MPDKYIYFDYNATFPANESHLQKVFQVLSENDGNPSSAHAFGRKAKRCVEKARLALAGIMGAQRDQVIFLSGATEANNWILDFYVDSIKTRYKRPLKVLMGASEHSSVYEKARALEKRGDLQLVLAPLNPDTGTIHHDHLLNLVDDQVDLVMLMLANNETGALNPIQELAVKIKQKAPAIFFHCDAVQGLGKYNLSWIASSQIDSASFSAHKVGGLKGIGALYIKERQSLLPQILGGGQEFGLRSGTENLAGIVSFGIIAERIDDIIQKYLGVGYLKEKLLHELECFQDDIRINTFTKDSLPNTINFSWKHERANLVDFFYSMEEAGILLSSGSACFSGKNAASRTLLALGCSEMEASKAVRISLSYLNTEQEIDRFLQVLKLFLVHMQKI